MPLPSFNKQLDELAAEVGGWPDGATVCVIEVIGESENPQVLLTGQIPTGEKSDGRPTFKGAKGRYKAVVRLAEYRACFAEQVQA